MNVQGRAPFADLYVPGRAKLRELNRTKAWAGAVLVASVGLLVLARLGEPRLPALGYVAAFAEAATIGGIADWYAIVVLFRRPLGLPIPHTAIIPRNRDRIAESLGAFIEEHFLAPGPVRAKLEEVDFAAFISDWLADRERSSDLANFVLKLLPRALDAADGSGLKDFLAQRVANQLRSVETAPLAVGLLRALTRDRRHQAVFDEILLALHRLMESPETLAMLRDRIRAELPTLLNLYRADAFVLKKVVSSTYALLEDVRADAEHRLRREFDQVVDSLIDNLASSPQYGARLEALRDELLGRPELVELAEGMWATFRRFLAESAEDPRSGLAAHLRDLLVETGEQLAVDARLRADMNRGFVTVLVSFIEAQKSGVSKFVADQVKSWDIEQLVRLVEINIGRDLQYIRFNGALIGGLVGLALYAAQTALRLG